MYSTWTTLAPCTHLTFSLSLVSLVLAYTYTLAPWRCFSSIRALYSLALVDVRIYTSVYCISGRTCLAHYIPNFRFYSSPSQYLRGETRSPTLTRSFSSTAIRKDPPLAPAAQNRSSSDQPSIIGHIKLSQGIIKVITQKAMADPPPSKKDDLQGTAKNPPHNPTNPDSTAPPSHHSPHADPVPAPGPGPDHHQNGSGPRPNGTNPGTAGSSR